MWTKIRRFLELIRFSHTVFALPFALLAAVLAWREAPFEWVHLGGIVACMVTARAAAMGFNRLVDRRIDAENPRTAGRHLPAGLLSVRSVVFFTLAAAVGFIGSTLLFLPNRLPLLFSVPVLAFLCGYSYAKRWTAFCHYWLSAALMLAPIATWIALTGTVAAPALLLAAVVFFWVGGFDILYACQDFDFDRRQNLSSIPAWLGIRRALWVAAGSHFLTVLALFALWHFSGLGLVFLIGLVLVSLLLVYEHAMVRPDDLSRVNMAFFHVNAIISLGIFLLGVIDIFW